MTELKPCPFCGSTDIRHDHPNRAPRVYCSTCRVVAECPDSWNTRPLPQPSELVERPSEAIEVLGGPYRQLDMDGVIVGVSRQAIYETLTYLTQLEAQIAKLQADGDKLAGALERSRQGWSNVLELGLLPVQHQSTALGLQEAATQALTEWKDRA